MVALSLNTGIVPVDQCQLNGDITDCTITSYPLIGLLHLIMPAIVYLSSNHLHVCSNTTLMNLHLFFCYLFIHPADMIYLRIAWCNFMQPKPWPLHCRPMSQILED